MKKFIIVTALAVLVTGTVFVLFSTTLVQAQTSETFTLNVTAVMGKGGGYDNFTYVREPNVEELSEIKFDITLYKGQGNNTNSSVVLSNVGIGSHVLPTLSSVGGREYSLTIKVKPKGADYTTNVFFGDIIYGIGSDRKYDSQNNPIITPISNGGTQNVQLRFRYNFASLEMLKTGFTDIPTILKAEIVDYKGSFVRSLTAEEKAQTSFEVVSFNGVAYVDPTAGQIITGVPLNPPANKLETTYNLRVEEKTPAGCSLCYRIINIKPPQGYVVRYIRSGSGIGLGVGDDFSPPWILPQELRDKYKDFLSPDELTVPTEEFLISFAPTFGSSLAKIGDRVVYSSGAGSGLALVKRFINTYGKWQSNDLATDLTSGYLEYHGDGRYGKNMREPTKPFPRGAKAVSFGGRNYLFINAGPQLMVYDLSSPTNPTLTKIINAKDILSTAGYSTAGASSDFQIVNSGGPTFVDIVVLDNSPYILASLAWSGKNVALIAALKVDSASMNITATSDLIARTSINEVGGQLFGYKGSGSKYYFISNLGGSTSCKGKLCSGSSGTVYAIYSMTESGEVSVEQNLQSSGQTYPGFSYPLQGVGVVGFATVGTKTYAFGKTTISGANYTIPATASLKAFDITSPSNIQEGVALALPSASYEISFDGDGKRMYVYPSSYSNQSGSVSVYDISNPLNIKMISSYSSVCDMTGLSEQSDVIKEIKKLYNIPESYAVVTKSGGCLSNSALNIKGNKGAVLIPSSYISLPGAKIVNQTENQFYDAFNAQYSSYGAPLYMVFVDLLNLTSPKILGIASIRQVSLRAAGGFTGGLIEGPISTFTSRSSNLYPIVIYRNRYVYRMMERTADVWEFKNIAATAAPTGGGGGGTGGGTGGGGAGGITTPAPTKFDFNSLLQIFRRILKK